MCSDGRMHFAACAQHGQHSTIGARIWMCAFHSYNTCNLQIDKHVCVTVLMQIVLCRMRIARQTQNFPSGVATVFVGCNIMTMIDATIHSKTHDTHTRIGHGIVAPIRLPRPRPLWQNCAEQSSIHVELPVVCPEHTMPDESCTNELKIALNRYRSLSQY